MTGHALARPSAEAGRRTLIVAAGCALGGALVALALIGFVRLVGGGDSAGTAGAHTFTAPGNAFKVGVPAGWTALHGAELAQAPGGPAAVIKRGDGRGLVIVRRIPPVKGDLRTVARDLTARLGKRIPGFRLVSARLGQTRAGGAFLYTFVRGAGGNAQSLAITTVRGATYRVDSVVPAAAPDVARQAGAIVGSFGP